MTEVRVWCPACWDDATVTDQGLCAWCGTRVLSVRPSSTSGRKRNANAGHPILMTDEVLMEARRLYEQDGLGFRRVARVLLERTGYRSERSMAGSLLALAHHNGWLVRDRVTGTVMAAKRHGEARRGTKTARYRESLRYRRLGRPPRPRCAAVKTDYPGRGAPCGRPAMVGSDYCQAHAPERRDALRAHLERARGLVGPS